jgi:hypothetical protein
VPWVAKLDKQGHVLWERRVAADEGPVLISALLPVPTCTALEAGDDGGVTLASVVEHVESTNWEPDGLHVPAQYDRHVLAKGTWVARFDGEGNTLHAVELDGAAVDKTFLFSTNRGVSVVDHIRPAGDVAHTRISNYQELRDPVRDVVSRSGARITTLTSALDKVDEKALKIPSLFDRVSAVFPLRGGGYLMAGCDLGSKNSVVWVTPSGSVGGILRIDPPIALAQCADMAFGRADSAEDYVLFTDAPLGLSGYGVFKFHGPTQ